MEGDYLRFLLFFCSAPICHWSHPGVFFHLSVRTSKEGHIQAEWKRHQQPIQRETDRGLSHSAAEIRGSRRQMSFRSSTENKDWFHSSAQTVLKVPVNPFFKGCKFFYFFFVVQSSAMLMMKIRCCNYHNSLMLEGFKSSSSLHCAIFKLFLYLLRLLPSAPESVTAFPPHPVSTRLLFERRVASRLDQFVSGLQHCVVIHAGLCVFTENNA